MLAVPIRKRSGVFFRDKVWKCAPAAVRRNEVGIAAVMFAVAILFSQYVEAAVTLALRDDRYFQIVIAPFLCAFLIFWHRARIFAKTEYSPKLGIPPLIALAVLCLLFRYWSSNANTAVLLAQLLSILLVISAFLLCNGATSFREALFPLGCLLLMIPLPPDWMDKISAGYQHGSAEMSLAFFRLTSTPVFRQGMTFSLPGLNIEIAKECSGIRSSLMFVIVGILTASLYLQSGWRKFVLIAATIPIAIIKNSVRIVTLSLLSIHVNRWFLYGPIHHQYGGVLSLPVDVALFIPLVLALRKSEGSASRTGSRVVE